MNNDEMRETINLEYYARRRSFIEQQRKSNDFVIMYKTYFGKEPDKEALTTYINEAKGYDPDVEDDEDIDDYEGDRWDEDEEDEF